MGTRIIDIARMAGVSTGTVDRVIHNRGEVSKKTREKISAIIDELEYEPDLLARSLAIRKNLFFFLLIPVSANENDFWYAPLRGVEKALSEVSHYGIRVKRFFFNHFDVDSFQEISAKVLAEKPDGVLFAPVFEQESENFMTGLKDMGVPVVLINSYLENIHEAAYIGQDPLQSGYLAGKLLSYGLDEGGHLLVVNISARKDNYNHILRRERGFRKYIVENFHDNFSISTLESMNSTDKELYLKLDHEFELNRIKGIFVSNSRVFQVAKYFQQKKIKNIRLIGYDLLPENINYLENNHIDFLISQRPEEQGYLGIITLFNRIFLEREIEKEHYLPIDIITKENINYYKFR